MTGHLDIVWAALAEDQAQQGFVQRRVLPESPHDCFLVESRPSGDLMLRLDLKDQKRPPQAPIPSTRGMRCGMSVEDSNVQIELKLVSRVHETLFRTLVDEVLELVVGVAQNNCAGEVLAYVRACMGFWSPEGAALSNEAAAGLYAELHVLQHSLLTAIDPTEALRHWTGPSGATHDFQFSGGAIEVKSWRGFGAPAPTISSELQLSTPPGGILMLHVVSLDQQLEGSGETIAGKVATITAALPHAADRAQFLSLLVEAGWTLASERLRTERYGVKNEVTFTVKGAFPRLTPDVLPNGIKRVRYVLETVGLEEYRLESLTLEGLE